MAAPLETGACCLMVLTSTEDFNLAVALPRG